MSFSQPIFQVRGTQLKPYYSKGSSTCTTVKTSATSVDATIDTNASAFGGKALNFTASSTATARLLAYSLAGGNAPSTRAMSFLVSIIPQWSGNPATIQYLFQLGFAPFYSTYVVGWITTAGKFFFQLISASGVININYTSTAALTFASGTPTDIMITTDGTGNAGSILLYQNGTLVESATPNANNATWNSDSMMFLQLGAADTAATNRTCNYLLNEFCIFDSVQPAYSPRSTFVSSPQANGDDWTNPGAASLTLGTTMHAGLAGVITGTQSIPAATDVRLGTPVGSTTGTCAVPSASSTLSGVAVDAGTGTVILPTTSQVQHGVGFGPAGALAGTYRAADLWQAVPANQLYKGIVLLQDGVSVTGTDDGSDFNDAIAPTELKIGVRKANHGGWVDGTYNASERWTSFNPSDIPAGMSYLADAVTKTGTRQTVTNISGELTTETGPSEATMEVDE